MRRFKSAEQAQRFLGPFGTVGDHFRTSRDRNSAPARRQLLAERRGTWREVVGLTPVVLLSRVDVPARPGTERDLRGEDVMPGPPDLAESESVGRQA